MNIFYRRYGTEGFPIVLLHGLFGSSDNLTYLAKKLSDRFVVYVPDIRNHGKSFHADKHNYSEIANDLNDFFKEHRIGKAFLIGHSMGGKVAMRMALDFPDKVEKLFVIDIAPIKYVINNYNWISTVLNYSSENSLYLFNSRNEITEFYKELGLDENITELIQKNIKISSTGKYVWKCNIDVIKKDLPQILGGFEDYEENTSNIKTYFLKATKSDYLKLEHLEIIKVLFPKFEIIDIPNAGHWAHIDQPELLSNILQLYLKI